MAFWWILFWPSQNTGGLDFECKYWPYGHATCLFHVTWKKKNTVKAFICSLPETESVSLWNDRCEAIAEECVRPRRLEEAYSSSSLNLTSRGSNRSEAHSHGAFARWLSAICFHALWGLSSEYMRGWEWECASPPPTPATRTEVVSCSRKRYHLFLFSWLPSRAEKERHYKGSLFLFSRGLLISTS